MEFIDLKSQYQRLKADCAGIQRVLDHSDWGQIPINLKLYAQSASSLDCGGLAATSVCGRGLT